MVFIVLFLLTFRAENREKEMGELQVILDRSEEELQHRGKQI